MAACKQHTMSALLAFAAMAAFAAICVEASVNSNAYGESTQHFIQEA
jgi:hypothetical protein